MLVAKHAYCKRGMRSVCLTDVRIAARAEPARQLLTNWKLPRSRDSRLAKSLQSTVSSEQDVLRILLLL